MRVDLISGLAMATFAGCSMGVEVIGVGAGNGGGAGIFNGSDTEDGDGDGAVSYTHLTLPTILRV